jgi:nucleoid-associated protein YgaU
VEIWLSNGVHDKVQIPVNPEEIGYEDSRNFEDIVLANGDEKTVIGGRNLRSYSIESFFPKYRQPLVVSVKLLAPMDYVKKIKSWMDNRTVIQLQVTTTIINELVTIRSFTWKEVGGAVGDIEYTLELKEYEPISFSKPGSSSAGGGSSSRPPSSKPKTRTYVVIKNDSLWKISKKFYGTGSKWKTIYDKNKKVIGKSPNFLKPGQRLIIP